MSKDAFHNEIYLRIFGEVQKEVLEAMLLDKYALAVRFAETRVVCIEKPVGTRARHSGAWAKMAIPLWPPSAFGLNWPTSRALGITYGLEVHLGSLPLPLHRAIEETVFETLKQGLYGWEVTDIAVTLTHSGYSSVASTARRFPQPGAAGADGGARAGRLRSAKTAERI
ncbi:MAG: hypothetical protein R2911_40575 [Caldilineaceae bacterium]